MPKGIRKNKSASPETAQANVAGEHIFPATHLTALALRWKELNAKKRSAEAMQVLEEIVVGSTEMFVRLAQHEEFHLSVDLNALVSAAQEKVIRWLLAWNPKKGRLFSWFSKCAKNVFRSERLKAKQYSARFYATSEIIEKLHGVDDHEVDRHDAAAAFRRKIEDISVRWGDPQELECLRFLIECFIDDEEDKHDRSKTIYTAACYAGISPELAKFFYNWALFALRDQMYAQIRVPFTDQDLLRHAHSYTLMPDLLDIIGEAAMKKLIATMGGQRIKIPTLANMTRLRDNYELHRDIDDSDADPATVETVGKKHRRSQKNAQEIYEDMTRTLDPDRSGEHYLYDQE